MIVPRKNFYIRHLRKYPQYNSSASWINWYAKVLKYKGLRTVKILKEYKNKSAKLLDVGSGIGLTFSFLAQEFPQSIGCDVDHKSVSASNEILKYIGLKNKVIQSTNQKIPFKDRSFDIVTCVDVFEHARDRELLLKEIKRVLKNDGILYIAVGNKFWPYELHYKLPFLSYLPQQIADKYIQFSGRGKNYKGIKLPSYDQFYNLVNKYFIIEDITFKSIIEYKKYYLDKEREKKIVVIAYILRFLDMVEHVPLLKYTSHIIKFILSRCAIGWFFIARPRENIYG